MTTAASDDLRAPGATPASAPGRRSAGGRIVVGVDGSPGSLAALRWAAAEAGRRRMALRIVSAWESHDVEQRRLAAQPAASAAVAQVQDALDFVVSLGDHPGSVGCVAPEGEPGKVLVEQAKGAEMLILGAACGAGPGSTAAYCLRFAPCPVVYVPA